MQWQLPQSLGVNNSGSPKCQAERWSEYLLNIDKVLKENVSYISLTDTNLNTHDSSDYCNSIYLRNMRDQLFDFCDNNQLAIINRDFTRFSVHFGNFPGSECR